MPHVTPKLSHLIICRSPDLIRRFLSVTGRMVIFEGGLIRDRWYGNASISRVWRHVILLSHCSQRQSRHRQSGNAMRKRHDFSEIDRKGMRACNRTRTMQEQDGGGTPASSSMRRLSGELFRWPLQACRNETSNPGFRGEKNSHWPDVDRRPE